MKRRRFLSLLGGIWISRPLAVEAQQPGSRRRIGVFIARPASDAEGQKYVAALRQSLEQLGWRPGDTIDIDVRWAARDSSDAEATVRELVAFHPDMLVVMATPNLKAARKVAPDVTTVFVAVADPVAQGFIPNLARPGGNMTGFGIEDAALGGKWIELFKEIAPQVKRVIAVFNPDTSPSARIFLTSMKKVGSALAVESTEAAVRSPAEIERAIAAVAREPDGGVIFLPDSFLHARRHQIVAAIASKAVPAMYYDRAFAEAGGLIAYGIDRVDLFHRAATYVHLILNESKPGELPVQMPSKFELVVNLRTANALGLKLPSSLRGRADEIID